GLYLLSAAQHADHHTVIDHAQPHCTSHEYFNGVLAERAHGVFNGRIIVRPGAQRTDSKQTNNNLLLSAEARADSQPQLEIYADDVKCTHGSTVGPIDSTQLYYLRSRGLSTEAARTILTYGFGAEILDRMRRPAVRERLDRLVRERLARCSTPPGCAPIFRCCANRTTAARWGSRTTRRAPRRPRRYSRPSRTTTEP